MAARVDSRASATATHGSVTSDLRSSYARETADTVRNQLPWAAPVFLATFGAVAFIELKAHPSRLAPYVEIYALEALACAIAIALTRSRSTPPARSLIITTALAVTLIAETTAYHVIVGGEAEVLALGNLFLTIGFLAAFPWGGWPQLAVASAACAGLAVGLFSDVHASVSGGIVIAGVLSLGGLSVVAAILTDRYRYSLFLTREELAVAYEHLKATQSQLVHSEKMASLGELVGGVTHELNNPTSFVHGGLSNLATYVSAFIELIKAFDGAPIADPAAAAQIAALKRRLEMDYLLRETPALLAICLQGSERIMKIIEDLRLFVRADQSGRVPTDVAAGLDRTVQMLGDRMGHSGITVIRNYELIPLVEANVAQLNQAWMHLLRNAIDAVESRTGAAIRLVIKYQQLGMGAERAEVDFDAPLTSYVEVRVEDNGVGISAATRERVFEPFFTTKPIGRGTGLGLSIAYGAIKSHRGTIAIESEPGRGTRVTVRLPIQNGAGLPHR